LTKRTVLRAGAGGVAALLAACTAGGGGAPPASAEVQGKVVWSVRVNAVENPWEQNVVLPRIKEQFPKIEVSLDSAPSSEWAVKVISTYAAGTPPDVHHGFAGIMITLYAQNQVLDLSPYVKRDKFDLTAFGGLQNDPDMCRSGKTWELPIDASMGVMTYYNASLLQQAGVPQPPTSWQDKSWTWDAALDAARKTTKRWGEADAVYGLIGFSADPFFQIWPYMWGGDMWPQEFYAHGIAQSSLMTTTPVLESIQHIQDLALKYRVMPAQGATVTPFAMGGAAMWVAAVSSGVTMLKDATFTWGIAPLPRQVTNKTMAYTNGIMANKDTKAPEASWQIIKYISSQEGQLDKAKQTAAPPTRTDALDAWLDAIVPKTVFKSKAQLKEVVTGYLPSYKDAWGHYVAEYLHINGLMTDLQNKLLLGTVAANTLVADSKTQVETEMRTTYGKFQSSPLSRDTLCS
jgi:multiple sugar transport system substrate-binding protein